jgi:uroporphyrinogen-III decarboxylase
MDIWEDQSVEARKARWRALWSMEDLPRPLWFVPASPILTAAHMYSMQRMPIDQLFTNRELQYEISMTVNTAFEAMQSESYLDDFIPHLQPQMGVGVFASAFGCEVEFPRDQMPWTYPVIRAGDPAEKVYELEPPHVESGLLGDVLDYARYFDEKAGHRYPIAMTDLQGPMDTAYLVWDSCDFMVAMYEHPKEVHHLMRLCTDLIVGFVKKFRNTVKEMVPAHFPPVYLPDGMGLAISEDVMAVLSPSLYEEFSLPYVNELSEEFGGILIHSCGNFEHQIPALKKVKGLRGINFGVSETGFEAIWEAFGGKTAVIPHCTSETIVADFKNAFEWVEYVLKKKTDNRGLALMVVPVAGDIHKTDLDIALGKKVDPGYTDVSDFGSRIRGLTQKYA